MTMEECYKIFGGNYQECLGRLRSDKLLIKFGQKFLDDGSYQLLHESIASGNMEEAFRAAHTLKGVSQNLSYTKLGESSHQLTEALRPGTALDMEAVKALVAQVDSDYQETAQALRKFFETI